MQDSFNRKCTLYGISASTLSNFPKTRSRIKKKTGKKRGNRLNSNLQHNTGSDPLNVKHTVGRPPIQEILPVKDLQLTVSEDLTTKNSLDTKHYLHSTGWRVGYKNSTNSYKLSAQGLNGILEPSDGCKEIICSIDDFSDRSCAYPPESAAAVLKSTIPKEWKEPLVPVPSKSSYNSNLPRNWLNSKSVGIVNLGWIPANVSKKGHKGCFDYSLQLKENPTLKTPQRVKVQVKKSLKPRPILETNKAYVEKRISQCHSSESLHAKKLKSTNALKDSKLMYSLPISHCPGDRSYRLGLDVLDDDSLPMGITKNKQVKQEQKKIRPKSAYAVSSTLLKSNSLNDIDSTCFSSNNTTKAATKVGGAIRRPHSAKLSFFKGFTLCQRTDKSNNELYGEFTQKSRERKKRINMRVESIEALSSHLEFNIYPISHVFISLRHQALKNIKHFVDLHAIFESITFLQYLEFVTNSRQYQHQSEAASTKLYIENPEIHDGEKNDCTENFELGIIDKKRIISGKIPRLWVSRSQFILSMDRYNLPSTALNKLYSSFDEDILDFLEIGSFCRSFNIIRMKSRKLTFQKTENTSTQTDRIVH